MYIFMKLHIFVCIVYECTHVRLEQLSMGLCFRQYFGKIVVESTLVPGTGTILGYQGVPGTRHTLVPVQLPVPLEEKGKKAIKQMH